MTIWELAAALVPTMLIVVAGITLIEHLRVRSEGERYRHREYRADEDPSHGNGSRGNGKSGNGRTRHAGRKLSSDSLKHAETSVAMSAGVRAALERRTA